MEITNHTEILQALIEKYKLETYLEIGVQNPANNLDKIKARVRVGVDPDLHYISEMSISEKVDIVNNVKYRIIIPKTSDDFFSSGMNCGNPAKPEQKRVFDEFDICFIDGMHTAEQVKRDFENSLKCLSDNGFILIHDCLPEKEETTHVPRNTLVWHGDVYKFAMNIGQYPNIGYKTFNVDHGCMLVWKENKEKEFEQPFPTDWQTYLAIRKQAMNIVDKVEI